MMIELNKIYNEDCLAGMKKIPDGSIDCIICDPPFGVTANAWDKRLPFKEMWNEYRRITKRNAAIVLFANNRFTIELAASAFDLFRYKWVWVKTRASLFVQCNCRPMTKHEDILVFSKGTAANCAKNNITYNPQGLKFLGKYESSRNKRKFGGVYHKSPAHDKFDGYRKYTNYPTDVLYFDTPNSAGRLNPSQKPVDLLEYLIKTYTNEGETVLDNCIGSGSTAVACVNTNRNFIGFEINSDYCEIANQRIKKAMAAL